MKGGGQIDKYKRAIVVPHTHWDREWYLSFQEYRLRLLKVLDRAIKLLKEGTLPCFLLDGQFSALEDYLEVRPEMEEDVKRLVSEGKLIIGPWYTQPDEFLASGEALIRNLLIGMEECEKYGGYLKIGYLPDTFGHIAQLPQILRGFELDSFVFSRGMGDEGEELGDEFIWMGPDGSQIHAIHLRLGYCNAAYLGVKDPHRPILLLDPYLRPTVYYLFYDKDPPLDLEEAYRRLEEVARTLSGYVRSGVLLLMNGCDHLPPQLGVKSLIKELNERIGKELIKIGSLNEYVEEVKKARGLPIHKGELRGARYRFILWSVYSTRYNIKLLNFKSQKLLELYAEPLATLNSLLNGAEYPRSLLRILWKKLLRNHAHDSIYGTGIDEVHLINEARYLEVIEGAGNIALLSLLELGRRVNGLKQGLIVYNPLNWEVKGPVELIVKEGCKGFESADGEKVKAQEVGTCDYKGFKRVVVMVSAPPLGYSTYLPSETTSRHTSLTVGDNFIENDYLKVEVSGERGGVVKLIDKVGGRIYEGLNVLIDEGDVGDEYNYEPSGDDLVVRSSDFRAAVDVIERGPVRATIRVRYEMAVPKGSAGKLRSKDRVSMPVEVLLTLYDDLPRLDVRVTVTNLAEDHRLRVLFPTGFKEGRILVGSQFYFLERPTKPPKGEGWAERPQGTNPMLEWVAAQGPEGGLLVAARGIYEYEASEGPDGLSLKLTLLRCVGWLSRGDLSTRRGHAGPPIRTPGAQCKGTHTFEYCLIPFSGELGPDVVRRALEFTSPLIAAPVEGAGEGPLPTSFSFAKMEADNLLVSSLKVSEDGKGVTLRVYEGFGRATETSITLFKPPSKTSLVNLRERELAELNPNRHINVSLRPFEIKTLKFYF